MRTLTPGDLTQIVVIQQNTTSTDAGLGRSSSWGTLATVRAHVEASTGSEAQDGGQQIGSTAYFDVTIRYRSDVTPKMRISWLSKTLEIVSVVPMGMQLREWTRLRCQERV